MHTKLYRLYRNFMKFYFTYIPINILITIFKVYNLCTIVNSWINTNMKILNKIYQFNDKLTEFMPDHVKLNEKNQLILI